MGGAGFLIILIALFALMYLLLIRPQRAQQRRTQEMLSRLAPGDEVITVGGIYGDVVEVEDDKVVLEIAEDVHIEVARRAIANIVPPETEPEEEPEAEKGQDGEELEPAATQAEPAAGGQAPEGERVEERAR